MTAPASVGALEQYEAVPGGGDREARLFAAAQLSATRRELEIARGKILGLMQQVVSAQAERDQALTEAEEQVCAGNMPTTHCVAIALSVAFKYVCYIIN